MSHSWWLPDLTKNLKLFEGKPEQIKSHTEAFTIRNNGTRQEPYYISWKSHKKQVHGTDMFPDWFSAMHCLEVNWKTYLDEEFEREVLVGSEQNQTNENAED